MKNRVKASMRRKKRGFGTTSGASELVTPYAGCYKTFKTLYPDLQAMGIRVFHSVQYMDELIQNGRIRFTGEFSKRVTYHDPCDPGRASPA
ncbi:MAG: (Fe-S)-binding protein [Deltaproteobacteria bacterium]|nr:(Fe-S)-binding protein [Deltaproteobacteria bacterium]